ncbi:ester cyclase [Bacteroidota bacterium]
MKKLRILILLSLVPVLMLGQNKKETADKEAIEKLIHKEVKAFLEKDWTTFESCWLQEPYSRHFVTTKNAFNGKFGWENMVKLISQGFDSEGPRGFSIEKTDIKIQVFEDAAYATFKEIRRPHSEDDPREIIALNNAFFMNDEGDWKFVCMNIVNTSSFEDARNNRALIEEYLEAISGQEKTWELLVNYIDKSREALIKQNIAVEQAFPKYELTPNEILVDGNRVVVQANFRGTQHGTYRNIAPTGNEVKFPVVLFFTLTNGKITENEVSYDNESMMKQLGVMQ